MCVSFDKLHNFVEDDIYFFQVFAQVLIIKKIDARI